MNTTSARSATMLLALLGLGVMVTACEEQQPYLNDQEQREPGMGTTGEEPMYGEEPMSDEDQPFRQRDNSADNTAPENQPEYEMGEGKVWEDLTPMLQDTRIAFQRQDRESYESGVETFLDKVEEQLEEVRDKADETQADETQGADEAWGEGTWGDETSRVDEAPREGQPVVDENIRRVEQLLEEARTNLEELQEAEEGMWIAAAQRLQPMLDEAHQEIKNLKDEFEQRPR